MSIASQITTMQEHIEDIYDTFAVAGVDTSATAKNIVNINANLKERLEYYLANGLDVVWNNWNKISGSGTTLSLNNTIQAKMDFVYKGNTSQSILPNGYTQVDYITSDGNSYIDTGKTLGDNFKIETKFIHNQQTSGEQPIISTWVQSFQWFNLYISSNNQLRFYASGNHTTSNPTLTLGSINTVSYSRNSNNWVGVLNGETVTFDTYIQTSNPTTFKILSRGDGTRGSYVSIYRLKLFENNILTMDLIPCYRNSDNVIGMYDIVNNIFYINSGTGTFTYGSIAPNPECPIPVNVVTGDNDIKVVGKNLVDTSKSTPNKSIYASGAILNSPNINTTDYIYVGDKSSIVISFTSDLSMTWNTCYFDENKNVVAGGSNGLSITAGKNGHIHTLSANQKYIRFSYPGDSQDVMLESGSSKTTFEPYKSQTYPINLGSMELCKIGDYQDYIAKSTGKNLFDENYYNNNSLYTKSGQYFAFVELPNTFKTKFYVNMSVKGTNQNLVFGFIDTMSTTFTGGIRVLNNGTLNSNVECDFTNAEHVYLAIGNSQQITPATDIPKIFDNYNIMVSTTSGEQYEPFGTEWYKYGAIGKITYTGASSENWALNSSASTTNGYYEFFNSINKPSIQTSLFANLFTIGTSYSNNKEQIRNRADVNIYVNIYGERLSTLTSAGFKNWLSSNNLILYYPLATPVVTEITDTTLIEQLEAIKLSYNERTNISQTNTDKPFILDVTALKDLDAEDTTPTLAINRGLSFTQPPVSENSINDEDDNSRLEETINEEEPNIEDNNREEEEPVDFFEKEIINNDEEQEEIPTESIEIDNGQR